MHDSVILPLTESLEDLDVNVVALGALCGLPGAHSQVDGHVHCLSLVGAEQADLDRGGADDAGHDVWPFLKFGNDCLQKFRFADPHSPASRSGSISWYRWRCEALDQETVFQTTRDVCPDLRP